VVLPGTSGTFLAVLFTTAAGAARWKYQKAQFTQDIKGGANDSEGWAAQINCGSGLERACPTTGASAGKSIILIKEWKPTTTVAPSEKEVEIYANAGHNYVESSSKAITSRSRRAAASPGPCTGCSAACRVPWRPRRAARIS
jgi:hypothetical protein